MRVDKGGEYMSTKFIDFMLDHGIALSMLADESRLLYVQANKNKSNLWALSPHKTEITWRNEHKSCKDYMDKTE